MRELLCRAVHCSPGRFSALRGPAGYLPRHSCPQSPAGLCSHQPAQQALAPECSHATGGPPGLCVFPCTNTEFHGLVTCTCVGSVPSAPGSGMAHLNPSLNLETLQHAVSTQLLCPDAAPAASARLLTGGLLGLLCAAMPGPCFP